MNKLLIFIKYILLFISIFKFDYKEKIIPYLKINVEENVKEHSETETETETETEDKSYTEEELYILSHVIYGEAGGYSREEQIGVGSVVLNRVKSNRYPDTIKDVVFQKGQYACTWDGNYDRTPDQQAIDVAVYLLENGSQYPYYVLYQSQFKQGSHVYKKIGNTYFCYDIKDVK